MKQKTYEKRMKKHEEKFNLLWAKIVSDTINFKTNNPEKTMHNLYDSSIDSFIVDLCLSGAWITDLINGYSGVPSNSKYRGSLTKKIRKALGYTL